MAYPFPCWQRTILRKDAAQSPTVPSQQIRGLNVRNFATVRRSRFRRVFDKFRVHRVCFVDHSTSQILRTIGLLPVWTGLRGSTVAFSGVHCRGIGSSQACPFRVSLIVSFEDAELISSSQDWSSKWKGFLVNSSARGDISASMSSAAC